MAWGLLGVDSSRVDRFDESSLGSLLWDDTFDLADVEAQQAVLGVCAELPRLEALKVRLGRGECAELCSAVICSALRCSAVLCGALLPCGVCILYCIYCAM